MDGCIFCKIINREIPADVIAESETALAFRDINPQAPVHFLVIPKKHIASALDLEQHKTVLNELSELAVQAARLEGIDNSGFRWIINTGKEGGQDVDHLHMHVLGGRRLTWPPG